MQRLLSKRTQLIGAIISMIIWLILTLGLLAALLTNQFSTVEGKIISGICIIYGILAVVGNARSYWKNRGKNENEPYIEEKSNAVGSLIFIVILAIGCAYMFYLTITASYNITLRVLFFIGGSVFLYDVIYYVRELFSAKRNSKK